MGMYKKCPEDDCPLYPCQPPCKKCTSATVCTECIDYDNRNVQPLCTCLDGFEKNLENKCVKQCNESGFYGTVDRKCLQCSDICKECSVREDLCTECKYGFELDEKLKTCNQTCMKPCKTCDGEFECLTCMGLFRDVENSCQCSQGYFEDSDQNCIQCMIQCKTCENSTSCKTCYQDDGEISDGYKAHNREGPEKNCACLEGFLTIGDICVPVCEEGQYVSSTKCLQCNPNCKTCEGQGGYCTSCSLQYYKHNSQCKPCPKHCKSCKNSGECNECDLDAIGRENTLPLCPCKTGFFERGLSDCGQCIIPCITCENTRNNCLSCIENGLNRRPAPDCNCLDTFYLSEGTCKKCSYKCKNCNIQPDICTQCHQDAIGRDKGEDTTIDNPACDCLDGWYDDGEQNKDCKQCEYPCDKCVGTSTNCISCLFALEDRNDPPNCLCSDGNFEDSHKHCQICESQCKTCENQENNCTLCEDLNRIPPSCDGCIQQYFKKDQVSECEKCEKPCFNCRNSNNFCLSCIDSSLRNEPPDCQCQPGIFEDGEGQCLNKCPEGCSKCGYTDDGENIECYECMVEVNNPYYFCDCKEEECLKKHCFQECKSCEKINNSNIFQCLSCKEENNDLLYDCKCKKGECYITECQNLENCEQCVYLSEQKDILECSKCVGNFDLSKNCLECENPLQDPLHDCLCNIGECGQNLHSELRKAFCDPNITPQVLEKKCKTCDGNTYECTECHRQDSRYLRNGVCVCDVFFEEIDGKCQQIKNLSVVDVSQTLNEKQSTFLTFFMAIVFWNPTLFINLLEALQMVSFNAFIQIDYPKPVLDFLLMFSVFDGGDLPNIVPENKYFMPAPKGFDIRGNDAFFFRNASQYVQLCLYFFVFYVILKSIWYWKIKGRERQIQNMNYFLRKIFRILSQFEYGVLIAGVSGSYLNFTVYCLVQMKSLVIDDFAKLSAFITAFCIYFLELTYPFFIVKIAKDVTNQSKNIQKLEEIEQKSQVIKEKIKDLKQKKEEYDDKFGFFYELFKENSRFTAGYFLVIAIRKLIFGFTLVYFNNYPGFNLVIFILICLTNIIINLVYRPYKSNWLSIFHIFPETIYIFIYCISFNLLGEDIDKETRKSIAQMLLLSFISILCIEFLFIIVENIKGIISLCKKTKKWIKKRKESKLNVSMQVQDTNRKGIKNLNLEDIPEDSSNNLNQIQDESQLPVINLEDGDGSSLADYSRGVPYESSTMQSDATTTHILLTQTQTGDRRLYTRKQQRRQYYKQESFQNISKNVEDSSLPLQIDLSCPNIKESNLEEITSHIFNDKEIDKTDQINQNTEYNWATSSYFDGGGNKLNDVEDFIQIKQYDVNQQLNQDNQEEILKKQDNQDSSKGMSVLQKQQIDVSLDVIEEIEQSKQGPFESINDISIQDIEDEIQEQVEEL